MNDDLLRNLRAAVDRVVPSYVAAHNARGNELVNSGAFDAAIAEFDEAFRLDPDSAPVHFKKGNLPLDLKRLNEAVAAFDRAVRCNPDFTDSYINRGIAKHLLGHTGRGHFGLRQRHIS